MTDTQTLRMERTFDAPAERVFEAWTRPELFRRWWLPRSMGMSLLSCEMDVRTGGGYRLQIVHPAAPEPMWFFGTYVEVTPHARICWTNDEAGEVGPITTVTFQEGDGATVVTVSERYPSKEALEAAGTGAIEAVPETLAQLDELLATSREERASPPPVSRRGGGVGDGLCGRWPTT